MQEKMEYFNMENPVDKAFIDGYNTALEDAAEWFEVYLGEGNTIDDWCRNSKVLENGREKFFNELGNKIEKGNTNGTESFILKNTKKR